MLNIFSKILLISVLVFSVSCSSIINGSLDQVEVKSSPEKAVVFVNGQELGPTPATLKLKRGDVHLIEIKKDGYQPYRITTQNSLTGWFWGNLLCGGLIGMAVDLINGNAYDVEPKFISATLNKDSAFNEIYELENFNGIKVADEFGNNLGEINIVWE